MWCASHIRNSWAVCFGHIVFNCELGSTFRHFFHVSLQDFPYITSPDTSSGHEAPHTMTPPLTMFYNLVLQFGVSLSPPIAGPSDCFHPKVTWLVLILPSHARIVVLVMQCLPDRYWMNILSHQLPLQFVWRIFLRFFLPSSHIWQHSRSYVSPFARKHSWSVGQCSVWCSGFCPSFHQSRRMICPDSKYRIILRWSFGGFTLLLLFLQKN